MSVPPAESSSSGGSLFDAVASKDYERMVDMYARHAHQAVYSYLARKSRWARPHEEHKSEEKLDEYLQHLAYREATIVPFRRAAPVIPGQPTQETSFLEKSSSSPACHGLLEDLHSLFSCASPSSAMEEEDDDTKMNYHHYKTNSESSYAAERLAWESATILTNARPSSTFVVYNGEEDENVAMSDAEEEEDHRNLLFDGSVANATPPPLGARASEISGGAGTLLHLSCALDDPLALAILLVLGGDARAPHTAFRRLVIHEAACSGSIQCLNLLLELGKQCHVNLYGTQEGPSRLRQRPRSASEPLPVFPYNVRKPFPPPAHITPAHTELKDFTGDTPLTFCSMLQEIRFVVHKVQQGTMSKLDAGRRLVAKARLPDATRLALARCCTFEEQGFADGHGNTPLHWAAFKNECECVKLLLQFNANPNWRAYPSGWTPLHDAAYSNSAESLKLLLDAGADVDPRAHSGATPLCFAAQEDAAQAAKLLLERGADLTTRCSGARDTTGVGFPHGRFSGYTPLHYCAHYNAHHAARILLQHPAAPHAMEMADLSDRLPIHVAVVRGSSHVLRELLHAGARVETNHVETTPQEPPPPVRASPRRAAQALAIPPPPVPPGSPPRSPHGSPPVSSPVLRSMIPARPITSSKPWNCLTQTAIDECRRLISEAEQNWAPDRHLLFTPTDRACVLELLRVGKRLEQEGTRIFVDLWPSVLSFCGRGWFDSSGGQSPPQPHGMLEQDMQQDEEGLGDFSLDA